MLTIAAVLTISGLCANQRWDLRRLNRRDVDTCRLAGVTAAERGVSLRMVVDLYLSATWLPWRHLPRPPSLDVHAAATIVPRRPSTADHVSGLEPVAHA